MWSVGLCSVNILTSSLPLVGFGEEAHVSLTSCLKVFGFVKVYSSDVLKTYINAMVYYTLALQLRKSSHYK